MKTTYDMRLTHEGAELVMSEKTAETIVSFYGARGKVSISTIIIHRSEALMRECPFTSIRIGYTPLVNHDERHGWEGCAYRGEVRVLDDSSGVRHQVEQVMVPFRAVYASAVDLTDMSNGGAALGRRIVRAMLRRYEALLEHSRRSIRDGFAGPVRDRAIRFTDQAYGQSTARSAALLGTLHWPFLLEGSDCGADCLDTVSYTTAHNPPHFLALREENKMEVEPIIRDDLTAGRVLRRVRHRADMLRWRQQQAERRAQHSAGAARAVELMRSACGEAVAEQFTKYNCVILEQDGYEFTLSPDGMIPCRDPNGKEARLCIHTRGFCCHPIDEIIIGYLNIRHRFADFMRTANVLCRDPGFRMPRLTPARTSRNR